MTSMRSFLAVGVTVATLAVGGVFAFLAATRAAESVETVELLNVSYDPTRELWKSLNSQFAQHYQERAGVRVTIKQSHGGSSSQARSVAEGLKADVVTLAMPTDTETIRKAGLIRQGWQDRLPNESLPYSSTIVFVVRAGNPKRIKDWPDLARSGVEVITPSPKTSGNGKLSFLAAWGSVTERGGSEAQALAYVASVYRNVPVLDTGARGSTTTFAQKGIGDVHLTWENEAHLEVAESRGELEIVYPPLSIRAEPRVALVDVVVDQKGTRKVAEAYLKWLYSDEAQTTIAENYYRPSKPAVLKNYAKNFPEIKLFAITAISTGWDAAAERFFAEGAIFDQIFADAR